MRPLFSRPLVFLVIVLGALRSAIAAPRCSHPKVPKVSNANTVLLKESVPPPRNWIDLGRALPDWSIPLRIALPQTRFDELERHLYETSDPSHARYGQHLLKEEVEELVKPPRLSVYTVDAWLAEYGIREEEITRSPAGEWVSVTVPVMLAEAMLHTVRLFHFISRTCSNCIGTCRNSICGSTPSMVMSSSARRNTVSRSTCTSTSNLCSPRRTSAAPRRWAPPSTPSISAHKLVHLSTSPYHFPSQETLCHLILLCPRIRTLTFPAPKL